MTKEMQIIAGKHKCGKRMDMRITVVKEDEKDKNSRIVAWMIHGFCKKCKVVIMFYLFSQEEEPINNVDYMIDYDLIAEEGKETD